MAISSVLAVQPRLAYRLIQRTQARYVNLGDRIQVEGDPERAIELLTQAINLDPKHPNEFVLFIMGVAYFMLGDNDAAIEWLQKATEKNPGFG